MQRHELAKKQIKLVLQQLSIKKAAFDNNLPSHLEYVTKFPKGYFFFYFLFMMYLFLFDLLREYKSKTRFLNFVHLKSYI